MKVRNLQKTGNMFYLYLPTNWCKKLKVDAGTKITIQEQGDGALLLNSGDKPIEAKHVELFLPKEHKNALIPLIMACYVNPLASFSIRLDDGIDINDIFKQKDLASVLEFVELDDGHIVYNAVIDVRDPVSLLKTMIKKIRNLFYILLENPEPSLIRKYEEEIDRTKILVQKSVISSLVLNQAMSLRQIETHYMYHIAIDLERLVDSIIMLDVKHRQFISSVFPIIDKLKMMIEQTDDFDYIKAAEITLLVQSLEVVSGSEEQRYLQMRIIKLLQNISEVGLDWSISKTLN